MSWEIFSILARAQNCHLSYLGCALVLLCTGGNEYRGIEEVYISILKVPLIAYIDINTYAYVYTYMYINIYRLSSENDVTPTKMSWEWFLMPTAVGQQQEAPSGIEIAIRPMLCANDWIVRSGVAGMAFAVHGLRDACAWGWDGKIHGKMQSCMIDDRQWMPVATSSFLTASVSNEPWSKQAKTALVRRYWKRSMVPTCSKLSKAYKATVPVCPSPFHKVWLDWSRCFSMRPTDSKSRGCRVFGWLHPMKLVLTVDIRLGHHDIPA